MTSRRFALVLFAGTVLLAACDNGPADVVLVSPEPILSFHPSAVACDFQNYVGRVGQSSASNHLQPAANQILYGLQPNFKWDNPYSCALPGWDLRVVRDDPSDASQIEVLYQVLNPGVLHFQIPFKLEPNTRYRWEIGPSQYLAGIIDPGNISPNYFWTGPFCHFNQYKPPLVFRPLTGTTISLPFPEPFAEIAHPGNCAASAYEYQLSTESRLSPDGIIEIYAGGPFYKGFFESETIPLIATTPDAIPILFGADAVPCATYYWRIRAVTNGPGGSGGPWSDTHWFFLDLYGTCSTIFDYFPDLHFEEIVFPEPSPYAVALENANCRLGDTSQHKNVATLFAGRPYRILAVNPQLTHVRVHEPDSDVKCWVWVDLLVLGQGFEVLTPDQLPDMVPIQQPPALILPTAEPEEPTEAPVFIAQCSDGIDNDGDQLIDLYDKGCLNANDNDEQKP